MDLTALFNIMNSAWILLALLPLVGYICWRNPYEYNTFEECVASIGGNEGTIMIANEQAVTDNLIIPANIMLRFIQGGILNVSVGITVTINGQVESPPVQIFTGAGTVTVNTYPKEQLWWGNPQSLDFDEITCQAIQIRHNADYMSMYHDGTDAFLTWSDGALNLQNTEADTNAEVHIHGTGTGYGDLKIYDEDDAEYLEFLCAGGIGRIDVRGVAPSHLYLQWTTPTSIWCWPSIIAGNPNFRISGWNTASATRRYGQFRMDDTNDEFEIEAENNANHEGITVLIQEANQKFRVRGAARALRFYVKSDGEIGTNQRQAATGPVGNITGKIEIFSEVQASLGFIPIYDGIT